MTSTHPCEQSSKRDFSAKFISPSTSSFGRWKLSMAKAYTETTLMLRDEHISSTCRLWSKRFFLLARFQLKFKVRQRQEELAFIIMNERGMEKCGEEGERGRDGMGLSYPAQRDEAVDVTLDQLDAEGTRVAPVAVHDERDVLRDGPRSEHAEERAPEAVNGLVPEPVCVLQERRGRGGRGRRWHWCLHLSRRPTDRGGGSGVLAEALFFFFCGVA